MCVPSEGQQLSRCLGGARLPQLTNSLRNIFVAVAEGHARVPHYRSQSCTERSTLLAIPSRTSYLKSTDLKENVGLGVSKCNQSTVSGVKLQALGRFAGPKKPSAFFRLGSSPQEEYPA